MSAVKHIGLFLLPITASAIGVAWYLDLFAPSVEVDTTSPIEKVEVVSPFKVLDYPENTQLALLPREWPSAELSRDFGTFTTPDEYTSHTPSRDETRNSASTQTTSAAEEDLGLSLDDLDLSSLSPDLARKVENALSRDDDNSSSQTARVNDLERNAHQWQGRLPALNLQTHMYASDENRRWVKINNVEYHQGDVVDDQVTLREIQPQAVIVEFQGEQIRIPALYEWKG
ncbi:general secretion pathway protein GspB [Vibrio alginolyticus]|uniref:general secretion pathway protein GspB n=1 Tax=Vibrio alginolyticus TaxID=663 RepID=UPI0006CA7AD6|nr:general secretion pathway protein GspB [Vibrio alginolyticus]EGR2554234.1 general secretion pathway protein GspB [Vibrio alginolyticus]EJV5741623.1 general secretion pathway protein GspB [Vibrio alginolyticus]EKD1482849.1 general secretion pathway protein GspB [Vibrio alginolyticus]KPM94347.1 general secretion pathway protein GspB [Vibrio alginolyticus]MCR9454325.1 general secretion pathway protein GspB [Vibrio alginolyticus]